MLGSAGHSAGLGRAHCHLHGPHADLCDGALRLYQLLSTSVCWHFTAALYVCDQELPEVGHSLDHNMRDASCTVLACWTPQLRLEP